MIEKKKTKPGPATVKGTPPKPVRKKRRILLWFFLIMFVISGFGIASIYQRWIPLDPEMDAKIDPYRDRITSAMTIASDLLKKTEPWLEKIGIGTKEAEKSAIIKPQTNFPLVDLEKEEKKPDVPPAASTLPGAPAIASAAPGQPPGAVKSGSTVKENSETVKIFGKLSKLYGAMKPEEAVAVFNNLEDDQVVMILSRMEEEAAAKILATIEPKRAARLTQTMIKRK